MENKNLYETKIMHFRPKGPAHSIAKFKIGNKALEYCTEYKNLGVLLVKGLEFEKNYSPLSKVGHRALWALIARYKNLDRLGYDT